MIDDNIIFSPGINYELNRKPGNNKLLEPNKSIGAVNSYKDSERFIIFIITENRDVANDCEWKRLYHVIELDIFLCGNVCE